MSETKHTPTWTIQYPRDEHWLYKDGKDVAEIFDHEEEDFIVTAVNAHAELVAALNEAAAVLEDVVVTRIDELEPNRFYLKHEHTAKIAMSALDKARTALAKAKGEK